MNFSYNDLLTMIAVAESHSVTSASNLLFTTRQNVSKTIAKLEKNLNIELFQRMHDGVYLTEKGKLFYNYALGVRDLQTKLMRQLYPEQYAENDLNGQIRIITIPHLMNPLLSIVQKFNRFHPNVDIIMTEMSPDLITEQMENGLLDADIFLFAQNENSSDNTLNQNIRYRFYSLGKQPLVLYANKKSNIANLDKISIHALADLNLVVYSPSTDLKFMAFSKDSHFKDIKANIKFHSNNLEVCKSYVLQNKAMLLGTITAFDFSSDSNNIVRIPFKENIHSHVLLATFNKELPVHIIKFIEIILSEFNC